MKNRSEVEANIRSLQWQEQELLDRSVPAAIWETAGITEHMSGLQATQPLLQLCKVVQGQVTIDIGCGTGITACHLVNAYRARVIAVDLGVRCVAATHERVAAAGLSGSVAVAQADAHALPFTPAAFDVALLESVAAFCDPERLAAEVGGFSSRVAHSPTMSLRCSAGHPRSWRHC